MGGGIKNAHLKNKKIAKKNLRILKLLFRLKEKV